MKKLMAICAATLMLAAVATSCSKVCKCTITGTVGGATFSQEINDIDLSGTAYKSCSAYADALNSTYTYVEGVKIDCKKQ